MHPDAGVRARVANLLGNMCRHSGFFYPSLDRYGILPPLIDRCSDPDKGARSVCKQADVDSHVAAAGRCDNIVNLNGMAPTKPLIKAYR